MSKLALVLLGASSVALGSTSLYLARQLYVERDNTQTLRAEVKKLEQSITFAQQSARVEPPAPHVPEAVAPPAKQVTTTSIAISSSAPAAAPSREEIQRAMRESTERQRTLMRNPEYRAAMLLQQKVTLQRQYPQLAEALGIGADQYDQLLSTLANQSMRSLDNQNGYDDSDPARARPKWQQLQQQSEAELRAVLGDKYQAWKDYQSNMMAYQQVEQVRNTLATSGLALTQDQAQALIKPIAEEQQRAAQDYAREAQNARDAARNASQSEARPPGTVMFSVEQQENQLKHAAESNQRVRDAAVGILTSDQLHQLEAAQNQQLQMQEASVRMMRAQVEASERGEVTMTTNGGTSVQYVLGSSTVTVPVKPAPSSTSSH
jgi:hypothetical protein